MSLCPLSHLIIINHDNKDKLNIDQLCVLTSDDVRCKFLIFPYIHPYTAAAGIQVQVDLLATSLLAAAVTIWAGLAQSAAADK